MTDQPPGHRDADSALKVWLKLGALLVGLAVFALLVFWLSRKAHGG